MSKLFVNSDSWRARARLKRGWGYILLGTLYQPTRIPYYTFAQKKERFVNNRKSREFPLPNATLATSHFASFLLIFSFVHLFSSTLISVVPTLYFSLYNSTNCGRSPAEIVVSNPTEVMDVCWDFCVLSGRGLCDDLITRPEESYRLWYVVVCDLEMS
jgi:hypothetical protein